MADAEPRTYTSGEICEKFGIVKNTLFRWESDGKIPPAERDWRNHRRYTEDHVRAIQALMKEKKLKHVRDRITQAMRDEDNPQALRELQTAHQLASAHKFTEGEDELGLVELKEYQTLAPETIRELLREAQRHQPDSDIFRQIIELVYLRTKPDDKHSRD